MCNIIEPSSNDIDLTRRIYMKRNRNKKLMAMICAMALVTSSMAGCASASSSSGEDYSSSTMTGKITSIDGTSVTLQLGELSEDSNAASNGAPEKPDGESGDSSTDTDSNDSGDAKSDSGEEPPEKPDGESDSSSEDGEAPNDAGGSSSDSAPEKPDGDSQSGQGGQAPSGGMGGGMSSVTFTENDETATVDLSSAVITEEAMGVDTSLTTDDLEEGDVIVIEFGDSNNARYAVVRNTGDSAGSSGEVDQGSAANTIDEDGEYSDESYTSDGDDENALRVDGAEATLTDITVNKSGGESSNAENGDFYGTNAGLLATNGANVTISGANITTDAQNGNGVFSYGEGTVVNISDSTITTSKDNSGGIQTTGGGTTNATNLTVSTAGSSAAAIRSDRGGGTVNVNKGTYTSSGYNSPAVYSTADITVKSAELTAENSEALVIEGQNSIALEDCDVSGNMSDTKGTSSDINVHNVMIYQSMSGDAEEGTSSFSMTGGSLTGNNGDMFYVTNTACTIDLSGVEITQTDEDGNLMTITGNDASNGWGTAGSNGAQVTLTADAQTLEGDIVVDSISTLNMTLSGKSDFTGTINVEDNADGGDAVDDNAVITIEKGSTWTLTGDCTVTSVENNGTINFNGHTITLADGTVLSD